MNNQFHEIPDFTPIKEILHCGECAVSSECNNIGSKYDCERFIRLVSKIKLIIEFILLLAIMSCSIFYFHTFWKPAFCGITAFIIIMIIDNYSDKIIRKACAKAEVKRRNEYREMIEKLNKENEAIKRANLGITEELQKFLDDSNNILNELRNNYNIIEDNMGLQSKEGERVLEKLADVNSELEILNKKLSKDNFETSYMSTLYKVHLPKLLEYTKRFVELLNSKTISQNQIIKYSDLLEVFRIKIANHTQYLQDKAEDDFIIKITALNEDVMPEFDGSEVETNE